MRKFLLVKGQNLWTNGVGVGKWHNFAAIPYGCPLRRKNRHLRIRAGPYRHVFISNDSPPHSALLLISTTMIFSSPNGLWVPSTMNQHLFKFHWRVNQPDKSESSAFLGPVISGNVNVAHFTVLCKEGLQMLYSGSVCQIIHFQTNLPRWRNVINQCNYKQVFRRGFRPRTIDFPYQWSRIRK